MIAVPDPLGGMAEETIAALLEEKGYRRQEMGNLTREYVARVLCHPRDSDGKLITTAYDPPALPGPDPWKQLRREQGWPEWRIDEEARVRRQAEAVRRRDRGKKQA